MDVVHRSRWEVDVPRLSFPDYIFQSAHGDLPNTPLLVDSEKPDSIFLSQHSFRLWSKRLAIGLQKAGLRPGDRVLVFAGNTIFFPVVVMGAIMAGGIYTGANPSYTARELAHQIKDSDPVFIISAAGAIDTVLEAAKQSNFNLNNIVTLGSAQSIVNTVERQVNSEHQMRSFSELLGSIIEGENFAWETFSADEQCDRTIALNYSSGTTGLAKGVEITHRNYIANTAALLFLAQLSPKDLVSDQPPRQLLYLPLYHAMAQTMCFVSILRRSIIYVMPKFDLLKMLECVEKFRITELNLAPPIVVAMVKNPRVREFDLSSVQRAVSGAAPLSGDLCNEFERLWPNGQVKIQQGWGMTEATSLITSWDPSETANPASVGELGPNMEARVEVLDEFARQYNRPAGELIVRGPNIMKGYWRNETASRQIKSPGGWIRTGDVGYFEDGKVFIVDRLKELIKVKAFQVAPAELEALLLNHKAVSDAAVIGVKTDEGEVPRAFVVLNSDMKATPSQIQAFVNDKVVHYKRLTAGVFVVDAIPKNPSGKILRKEIRSWKVAGDKITQIAKSKI